MTRGFSGNALMLVYCLWFLVTTLAGGSSSCGRRKKPAVCVIRRDHYFRTVHFKAFSGVPSSKECQKICTHISKCHSWTYCKQGTCAKKCLLQGGRKSEVAKTIRPNKCCDIGLACRDSETMPRNCSKIEENVEYTGGSYRTVTGVKSSKECQYMCTRALPCDKWTFCKQSSCRGKCFLKTKEEARGRKQLKMSCCDSGSSCFIDAKPHRVSKPCLDCISASQTKITPALLLPPGLGGRPSARVKTTLGTPINMLLCTMVLDEAKTIVEWIVFHLQQGFTQIWVYTDIQGEDPGLTYRTILLHFDGVLHPWTGKPVVIVKRIPMWWKRSNHKDTEKTQRLTDEKRQYKAFNDCYTDGGGMGFNWIGVHDVDEFHFSPAYDRLDSYMRTIPAWFVSVVFHQYRFGTNGYETTRGWPELITATRRNRSASIEAGEKALLEQLKSGKFKQACADRKGHWNFCKADGVHLSNETIRNNPKHILAVVEAGDCKSMTRPKQQCHLRVHVAHCTKGVMMAPVSMAVGNHYYYRSKRAAEIKAWTWHKSDPKDIFDYGGERFFNQVRDDTIRRFVPRLREAMVAVHKRKEQIVASCFSNNRTLALQFYSLPVLIPTGLGHVVS